MMITNFKSMDVLWPTLVFTYEYERFWQDKNALLDEIYEEANKQETDIDSNVAPKIKNNIKESKFDFLSRDKPAIKHLRVFFEQSLSHLITQALPSSGHYDLTDEKIGCSIRESWYHIANNDGRHGVHTHPNTSWAGIFYAQTGDSNVDNLNGINTMFNFNLTTIQGDPGTEWTGQQSVSFKPKEGQLLLFPGWIPHEATPYAGEKDRIIVSANSNFYYER